MYIFGLSLTTVLSRQYFLDIRTGDETNNCGSSTNHTLIFVGTGGSISTKFIPSYTLGESKFISFSNNNSDTGLITNLTLIALDWDGWCFDYLHILLDINVTHKLWANCNYSNYNEYGAIFIDGDNDIGHGSTTSISLDMTKNSLFCHHYTTKNAGMSTIIYSKHHKNV